MSANFARDAFGAGRIFQPTFALARFQACKTLAARNRGLWPVMDQYRHVVIASFQFAH